MHGRHFEFQKGFQNVRFPNLVHFAFTDTNRELQEVGVVALAKACPHLRYLNLSGVAKLDNYLLQKILQGSKHINYISLLRNNKITNDVFNILRSDIQVMEGLELGGKPTEFQHNISLDGIENLCETHRSIKYIKFEYCSKIGSETIMKLATTLHDSLRHLSIIRNFNEKSARIDDEATEALATCCPNLEHLEIVYSRKFDERICRNLGNGNLLRLQVLDLSYCPIQCSMEPLIKGCPDLFELKLAGDSFIRKLVLLSIAKLPELKIFHLGHFDHSDVECKKVIPQDPVFKSYSTKGIVVAKTFEDPANYPKL